jgi:hypothetical protein
MKYPANADIFHNNCKVNEGEDKSLDIRIANISKQKQNLKNEK